MPTHAPRAQRWAVYAWGRNTAGTPSRPPCGNHVPMKAPAMHGSRSRRLGCLMVLAVGSVCVCVCASFVGQSRAKGAGRHALRQWVSLGLGVQKGNWTARTGLDCGRLPSHPGKARAAACPGLVRLTKPGHALRCLHGGAKDHVQTAFAHCGCCRCSRRLGPPAPCRSRLPKADGCPMNAAASASRGHTVRSFVARSGRSRRG